MPVIPIDRSTIRKNPDAGSTRTYTPGAVQYTITSNLPLPERFSESVVLSSQTYGDKPEFAYRVTEHSALSFIHDWFITHPNGDTPFGVDMQFPWTATHHDPEPEWHYGYGDPELECLSCGAKTPSSDISYGFEDMECEWQECPECKGVNTFGNIEHEYMDDWELETWFASHKTEKGNQKQ